MTLLITVFAAVIATVIWYNRGFDDSKKLAVLCFMYWGASIMWFADALFEYIKLKADYFSPMPADMLNDTFLGLSVVALGLIIWLVVLLVKDPEGIVKKALLKKS